MNTKEVKTPRIQLHATRGIVFACAGHTKSGALCTKAVKHNQRYCNIHAK